MPSSRRLLLVAVAAPVAAGLVLGGWWLVGRDADPGAAGGASAGGGTAHPSDPGDASAAVSSTRSGLLPTDVTQPAPSAVATDTPVHRAAGTVQVVVTYAGWESPPGVTAEDGQLGSVVVNGYVAGTVESGGTCHVELTGGGVTLTAESDATPDAHTTVCPPITIQDPQLVPGTWQATLGYSSDSSSGTAKPVTIEVTPR